MFSEISPTKNTTIYPIKLQQPTIMVHWFSTSPTKSKIKDELIIHSFNFVYVEGAASDSGRVHITCPYYTHS